MKKIIFIIICTFNFFIMNVKGITYDTLAPGPISWNNYYYTKVNNETGDKSYSYMQMFVRNSDGKYVYCIEPGVTISYDEIYSGYDSNQARFANLSKAIYEKVSLIAYFGYGYQDEKYDHTDSNWWAVTQWMIWQEANNNHTLYFTQNQNYSGNEPQIERFTSEMLEINELINNYYTMPAISIPTLVLGQTIELYDYNQVLHNYSIRNCQGCEAYIEEDRLIIKATAVGNSQVSLERRFENYNSDPIVYVSNNYQNAMAVGKIKDIKRGIGFFITAGQVELQKNDFDTHNNIARGDAVLSNAIYGIYDIDNREIATIVTDSLGNGISSYLQIGSYYIKEIKSSNGYTLDPTIYYFNIDSNHLNVKINVYEKIIEKNVEITKVKASNNTSILEPEPHIDFEFYLQKTNELYIVATTDSNGKISVTLPFGNYVVHQVNSDNNVERIDDFVIRIDNSSEKTISRVIANASLSARVKVIKKDADTNVQIKTPGIEFKIKNLDTNEYVCQYISYPESKKLCSFKTNNDGEFITPYPLEYGNYQIEEIDQLIPGYLINLNPVQFSISNENTYYDTNLGLIKEVNFNNKKVKGIIKIIKYGEKVCFNNNGFYYEKTLLNDVDFSLYKKDNMELIGSYKTVNGRITIDNLDLGEYVLMETRTVNNHLINNNKQEISITYQDQYTDIITKEITINNYLPKGTLIINKKDLLTGEGIPNTLLEIYTINNKLIYRGLTDENGQILINDLFLTKGYIVEKEANSLYKLSSKIIPFELTNNNQITEAELSNERITVEVPNTEKNNYYVFEIITSLIITIYGRCYVKKKKC